VRIFQRGGSDGTDTRMYEATGEALLIQKRKTSEKSRSYNQKGN
jgi:hypothetical protein